jgi:hypothetical protein
MLYLSIAYVKRVPVAVLGTPYGELRALRMSDIATVLKIEHPVIKNREEFHLKIKPVLV